MRENTQSTRKYNAPINNDFRNLASHCHVRTIISRSNVHEHAKHWKLCSGWCAHCRYSRTAEFKWFIFKKSISPPSNFENTISPPVYESVHSWSRMGDPDLRLGIGSKFGKFEYPFGLLRATGTLNHIRRLKFPVRALDLRFRVAWANLMTKYNLHIIWGEEGVLSG